MDEQMRSHLIALAKRRPKIANYSYLGVLVGPLTMSVAWYLSQTPAVVQRVGTWVFCVSNIALVVSFFFFEKRSAYLKPVTQHFSHENSQYKFSNVEYMFEHFTLKQFDAHRSLHIWGEWVLGSLFSLFGYGAMVFIFNQFVWSLSRR